MAPRSVTNVIVLGSTGSVGTQTLDVVRAGNGAFRVVGLAGHSRWEELARQAEEFAPAAVGVGEPAAAERLRAALNGRAVAVLDGPEGLRRLASWPEADVVVNAVAGAAGLPAALAALGSGKKLALANKEPVVMCGHLLMEMVRTGKGTVVPVDSEHSAAFQLLEGVPPEDVARLVLTASGGPFRGRRRDQLARVTPSEALNHPTWRMGPKITIDSATLMNKALEIVEAHWLFGLPAERIGVVIHPQSIIHAMVELVDGSVLAHMGAPDMRLPIQYALGYPRRLPGATAAPKLAELGRLELCEPDEEAFPALGLGFRVARRGGTSGAVLSAANEVAVAAFLDGRIRFTDIVRAVEMVLDRHEIIDAPGLDAIMAADRWAREETESCLSTLH